MSAMQINPRLRAILVFFIVLGSIGIITNLLYGLTTGSVGSCLIWALCCLTAGMAIGFLFGIPKIVQGSQTTTGDKDELDYKLNVNTNLTEISDWLTKIIVGLGLVKLTKLPPYLTAMAASFSEGIHEKEKDVAMAVGYGTVIFFSVLGFLFGYLFTRLFLSKALSIADQDSIQQLKGVFDIQIANLESKQGFLAHSISRESHDIVPGTEIQAEKIPTGQALATLKQMADAYMAINIADVGERTRAKDAKANEMGGYALKNGIDSTTLFQYIQQQPLLHEGLVLALATLINIDPHQNDFAKLLQVGDKLTRLHVRYRVLLAIITLQKRGFIDDGARQQAISLVKGFRVNADGRLLEMIGSTLSFLATS